MTWDAWFVFVIISLCFGLLATNRFSPDLILMGGVTLFLVSGIISPSQALAGLANEGMVTVAVLYIVVTGIRETGGINWIVQSVLGVPKSLANAQIKVMAPVAVLSAFLNNTPVVAVFIPAIEDWAKRHRISVSKLMLPLSYAAIAGGTCTLIGTSTNLVINGMVITETTNSQFGIFDLAWVGVPVTLVVFAYVLITQSWLLPERRPAVGKYSDVREYTVEMLVEPDSPLVGKSIEQAGLRQLPGLYLIEIERNGTILTAVPPNEILLGDDQLVFVGIVDSVIDLQRIAGLKPATNQVFKLESHIDKRCLTEAVISNTSPLVGKTVREGRFRSIYNAAIIAVARNGEKITQKIGNIKLRAGDTLLLVSNPAFVEQQHNSRDFYLVSGLPDAQPIRHKLAPLALTILFGMVVTVAFGWLSMLKAAMLAAGLMIITRCTTGRIARRAVDWQVLIVIAASFGIASALQNSGAASAIAQWGISIAQGHPLLALTFVFALTAMFSIIATNNAAAVIMFPIALSTSEILGISFLPFAVVIMVAASASFATPIGYQTNLMVFGVGGYHFKDYFYFGAPLTVIVGIVTISIVPWVWHL
ncbi:MAG: SLC13 family permease [Pseudomonadota bacterium]|nr:SLC13 family permease [Pseudomonadota bacterium]